MKTNVDSKEQRKNQLFSAILNGNEEEIHTLLNEMDVNTILRDNYSPLMLAASIGNPCVTKLLIEKGANVNYDRGM